jgi:hypothetical protein
MVERDLNRGYISRSTAESVYGVVIAEEIRGAAGNLRYRLDEEASMLQRRQIQARPMA